MPAWPTTVAMGRNSSSGQSGGKAARAFWVDGESQAVRLGEGTFSQPRTGTAGLVRGLVAEERYAAMAAALRVALLRAAEAVGMLTRKEVPKKGWSWRFWPTPGRWCRTVMLRFWSVWRGPMPETIRSWGDWKAPADRITSFLAVSV